MMMCLCNTAFSVGWWCNVISGAPKSATTPATNRFALRCCRRYTREATTGREQQSRLKNVRAAAVPALYSHPRAAQKNRRRCAAAPATIHILPHRYNAAAVLSTCLFVRAPTVCFHHARVGSCVACACVCARAYVYVSISVYLCRLRRRRGGG